MFVTCHVDGKEALSIVLNVRQVSRSVVAFHADLRMRSSVLSSMTSNSVFEGDSDCFSIAHLLAFVAKLRQIRLAVLDGGTGETGDIRREDVLG